jgi:pimeloyl-ACP methyl ester carboxylesterase
MTRHIDIAGPTDAPPLVLLHGASANRKMWHSQVEALSDEFRVIAPDLPGHGDHPIRKFRFGEAVADVQRLIDEEAGGSALVLGLSGGGYVAIGVAHDTPSRVNALVLSGSTAEYLGWGGLSTRLFGVAVGTFAPLMSRISEKAIRRGARAETAEAMIDVGISMRAASQSLLSLPGRDYHGMLEDYRGPVLILNGERDKVNRENEQNAARRWGARLAVLEDCGHACALSQPEAFTEAARVFLRSHGSTA